MKKIIYRFYLTDKLIFFSLDSTRHAARGYSFTASGSHKSGPQVLSRQGRLRRQSIIHDSPNIPEAQCRKVSITFHDFWKFFDNINQPIVVVVVKGFYCQCYVHLCSYHIILIIIR